MNHLMIQESMKEIQKKTLEIFIIMKLNIRIIIINYEKDNVILNYINY